MREQKIDVDLVIPRADIIRAGGFEHAIGDLLRRMRDTARARAEEIGGDIRVTLDPELVIREGISPILGDVFLLGTRWVCDVPEDALTTAER